MKKIKYLILILVCMFSFNLNVMANSTSGASKTDIESKLDKKNGVIIGNDNFACFYKNGNNYIVIKFIKGSNGFKITSITHNFAPSFSSNPTILIDNKQYSEFTLAGTKTTIPNFCSQRIIKYDGTTSMMYIDKVNDDSDHFGNEYEYDSSFYTLQSQSQTPEEETNTNPCTKSTFGTAYLSFNDNEGWYLLNTKGEKICFANPSTGTNDFKLVSHISDKNFDDKFVCENYNVAKNVQGTYSCDYFLYEASYQDNVTDNVSIEKTGGITSYVEFNNSNATSIVIMIEDSNVVVAHREDKLKVSNLNQYLTIFKNKEIEKYPKYLIKLKESDTYKFVEEKKDKNGNLIEFDKIYMNVSALYGIKGLGEAEMYSTCLDIFGNGETSEFLEWLDENVFMIIRIGVPILLILLTSFDFAKVVFSDDKEGMSNAFKRFTKRAIAAILIFLTPTIIMLIANLIGGDELKAVTNCVNYIENMHE